MNTKSIITSERVERAILQRYAPFPELTMDLLSRHLNAFRVGDLRQAARIWEIMMERDGDLSTPAEKLFSDIARLPWEIEKSEESREAERHADALKYFYENLTATSALDGDETGGINLLLRQMMTAHAYRYSVHEMVLEVNSAGKREVTGRFIHCPVWFFEARKGRLAFLRQEFEVDGQPLESGGWLPAVGRGVMRQCSVAYLTKWQPMAYWGLFCYRFGVPGIHGKTDAVKDSPEWKDFQAALESFANDWVTVSNRSAEINLVEASKGGSGTLPFQELIERSDRLYARCFRGGDLSTQSRAAGEVAGSNPQEGEKRIILEDGGQWATDILNTRVDEPLIAYLFNAEPKAWIRIRPPAQMDSNREINVLKAARELGVPVSIETARERLEIPVPEEGEELIQAAQQQVQTEPGSNGTDGTEGTDGARPHGAPGTEGDPEVIANSQSQIADRSRVAKAVADILRPVLAAYDERLQRILTITDPGLRAQRWGELQAELAVVEQDYLADPAALQRELERINATALAAGLTRRRGDAEGQSVLGNYDAGQPRDEFGRWVDANGGGLSEHDNIQRGQRVMEYVIKNRRDVQKGMYRKEVGQIVFPWGHTGDKALEYKNGGGFAKMLIKHPEEVKALPVTIAKGRIIPHDEDPEKKYVIHGDNLAVLSRVNKTKAWAITHFEDRKKIKELEQKRRPSWMTGEIEGR